MSQPNGTEHDRFFQLALDMLCVASMEGRFLRVNPAFENTLGHSQSELLEQPYLDFVHPEDQAATIAEMDKLLRGDSTLNFENRYRCKDGTYKWLSWRAVPSLDEAVVYAVARDVTDRKSIDLQVQEAKEELERTVAQRTTQLAAAVTELEGRVREKTEAEAQLRSQVERMEALRKIDMAIMGSVDLRIVLDVVLGEVTAQLGVDAASVLLINASMSMLEYAAGKGFRCSAITQSQVPFGKGLAGRTALERAPVYVRDLLGSPDFSRANLVNAEDFVSYASAPLFVKGRVRGVIEVFHRSELRPDQNWFRFLETLAGQAAIAIDNASMFQEMENSNIELRMAYEATLEGWVSALDMRDHETEGHTQRVTEMTVRLARYMRYPESGMVHLRRGALLHDIGKIAIPDAILLKPDKLTEEEMEVMRQHTVYAFKWLSPIQYLAPAIDIPFCHHERWDGSGYPRGLKGEEIPLAARIFAVVDVWDALSSDRPYRNAWPQDRVLEYILGESGKHFDPKVVKAFLELMATQATISRAA